MTDRRPRRRGSVAIASRVAIGGLSLSVTLGMVGALALSEPPDQPAEAEPLVIAGPATTDGAPAAPGTTIVVRRIHVVAGPPATGSGGATTSRSTSSGPGAAAASTPPVAAATPVPSASTAPDRSAPAPVARSRAS